MTIYTLFLYLALVGLALTGLLGYGHSKLRKQEIMRPGVWFLQYFLGSLLLFSGFIKAVDPLGTAYKMTEYFEEFERQGLPLMGFFSDYALAFSIVTLVLELLLGVCMVLGIGGRRTTLWTLLLMVFFTLLTGFNYLTGFTPNNTQPEVGIFQFSKWTAFNPDFIRIKDCGCFGDFMKLTPLTTFIKDIVLTLLSIALHLRGQFLKDLMVFKFKPEGKITARGFRRGLVLSTTVMLWLFCLNNYMFNDAFIDFRPFYTGVDIRQAQADCKAKPTKKKIEYEYLNEQTGEKKYVPMEDLTKPELAYLFEAPWKMGERRDVILEEGCTSKIVEFGLENDESETQTKFRALRDSPKAHLVVMAGDLEKSSLSAFKKIAEIAAAAEKDGMTTDAFYYHVKGNIEDFRHQNQLPFPFTTADDKLIKTVIRANPGLVLIRDGKIVAKWHHWHIPSYEKIKELAR